ncbi:hypothetical protein L9F63_001338 [Diploptera punctata]|uniref:Gustatory receptor n=1 Tax=Diploptera punctata TaxID=6984 RepID=A0AAD8A4R5_DIPPU|nr:hypothetical protein L9F63_001338 [Diploptera punctata]
MCKLFGLAPYTIHINRNTGEGSVDVNVKKNLGGWLCTITLLASMIFELLDSLIKFKITRRTSVSDTLSRMFCIPMLFFYAATSLLINGTVIKNNIKQLLKIFSDIDKGLFRLHRVPTEHVHLFSMKGLLSKLDVLMLIFVIVPYLIYDSVIWGIGLFFIHSYLMRISQFISIITVMQYCKFVIYVWKLLSEFCKILSEFIEYDYSRNEKHIVVLPQLSRIHPELRQKHRNDMTETIIALRRMYSQLCDAVHLINVMYGFVILLEIATDFTVGITGVSTIMTLTKTYRRPHHLFDKKPVISNVMCILISIGLIISTVVFCQIAIWKSKQLGFIVSKISLIYPLNPDTLEQLKLFNNQIYNNSFEFSAFWLFRLDSNLLCTIFASAVTYTAVIIQLSG